MSVVPYRYVNNCMEMAPTYKLLKPHMEWLLFQVIFSTFPLTVEEKEVFHDDPSEFVRKVHDPTEEWIDLRCAAINVMTMTARYREKDNLAMIMTYIQGVFMLYMCYVYEKCPYRLYYGSVPVMHRSTHGIW